MADLSSPDAEIGLLDPNAPPRTRRASSDCFRGPVRRRMLRGSSASPGSLASVKNRVNSPLFKRFLDSLKRSQLQPSTQPIGLGLIMDRAVAGVEPAPHTYDLTDSESSSSNNNNIPTIQLLSGPNAFRVDWPEYRAPKRLFAKRTPENVEPMEES